MTAAHAREQEAVRDGGVGALDARGLMPLAEARAIVGGVTAFVRGEGQPEHGRHVLASDAIWAALLSLADGAELVAAASRLDWQFSPRGFDNVDLYLRYGDAIVPWLATRVDADGVLRDQPWCVVPCLLACGDAAAFELVWRVRRVEGRTVALARAWLDRHPAVGAAGLHARADDPRARAHLVGLRLRGHGAVVDATCGPAGAVTAEGVLATLDACALQLAAGAVIAWPSLTGAGAGEPHGFRAIAARDGDAWGLAIERIDGDRARGLRAAACTVFGFGSRVVGGAAQRRRPLALAGAPVGGEPLRAWLAARIRDDLDGLVGAPAAALAGLGLGAGARIVAVVPHLAHVAAPDLPSGSRVYQALARALADHRQSSELR